MLKYTAVQEGSSIQTMSETTVRLFRPSPDIVCRRVGDESVLVPVRQNVGNLDSVYTLSPVAARVWELLDGTRDAAAIAGTISDEYDVDAATAAQDVEELLAALEGAALIKPA